MMNRRIYLSIGIGVVIVAVLAGGAFMAMRLLNAKANGSSGLNITLGKEGGKQAVQQIFKQIPAPEVPKQAVDLRGLVISVKDNSVFVAQMDHFGVRVMNGVVQEQPTPAGPYTQVVITKSTKIWRDVTEDNQPEPSTNSSGIQQVQQKVETADISGITAGTGTFVEVWGAQRGDRLNADVIVVHGIAVAKSSPVK